MAIDRCHDGTNNDFLSVSPERSHLRRRLDDVGSSEWMT